MSILTGTFATPNASKYLQQLCKHFGHKVPAEWSEAAGKVDFIFGQAKFAASEARLEVTILISDEGSVDVAKDVIDRHLERFAFREEFKQMDWTYDKD